MAEAGSGAGGATESCRGRTGRSLWAAGFHIAPRCTLGEGAQPPPRADDCVAVSLARSVLMLASATCCSLFMSSRLEASPVSRVPTSHPAVRFAQLSKHEVRGHVSPDHAATLSKRQPVLQHARSCSSSRNVHRCSPRTAHSPRASLQVSCVPTMEPSRCSSNRGERSSRLHGDAATRSGCSSHTEMHGGLYGKRKPQQRTAARAYKVPRHVGAGGGPGKHALLAHALGSLHATAHRRPACTCTGLATVVPCWAESAHSNDTVMLSASAGETRVAPPTSPRTNSASPPPSETRVQGCAPRARNSRVRTPQSAPPPSPLPHRKKKTSAPHCGAARVDAGGLKTRFVRQFMFGLESPRAAPT